MNAAIWFGLFVNLALLVWLIFSMIAIKGSLRRIALSLPVTPEQMKLIKGTISTDEAMKLFEMAGGTFEIRDYAESSPNWMDSLEKKILGTPPVRPSSASISPSPPPAWDVVMRNAKQIEPELVQILENRKSEIGRILKARRTSNP